MSYSQRDEESIITKFFAGRSARFLDIGAHDGVTFSNTRALSDKGWSGVLVEPSPMAFANLMANYEKRPSELVHAAVIESGPMRLIEFHDSHGDMVSTTSELHRKLWEGRAGHRNVPCVPAAVRFQPIRVAALSAMDLVAAFPGPYAFISLDVEGTNLEVFRALPLLSLGVEMICVEFQERLKEIEAQAALQGFRKKHLTNENVILVRR